MCKPKLLYHYTSFSATKNILDTQKLRLTHYKCVQGDSNEYLHSEELIKNCLTNALLKINGKNKASIQEEFDNALIRDRNFLWKTFQKAVEESYLVCFSAKLESQQGGESSKMWGEYAKEEGCALVLNYQKLINYITNMDNIRPYYYAAGMLEPIIYLDNNIPIPSSLNKQYKQVNSCFKDRLIPDWSSKNMTREDIDALISLIIFTKHKSFNWENEYRLCLLPLSKSYLPLEKQEYAIKSKIRKRGSSIVDYIEFPIDIGNLVEKIIIGPQADADMKKEFLESYLLSKDLNSIQVEISDIPYVAS